jgi:group II intron reverse transcriptase/maturase
LHHLNVHNLRQAFRELDGSKASGIDHVTKEIYRQNLTSHLETLAEAIRRGGWRPKPSREVLIPKPQGGSRPLAVGCLEDKIVQTLVARILEAIYEPIFHRHSYGFRRGKSAHKAIGRLYAVIHERQKSCVVVEMDIEKFFNSMDHEWLMHKIEMKIADPHFLRLIRRMLRNSILTQDGSLKVNERGSPQGSPVSPILANIYLHYLLDEWFVQNFSARGHFVRYADDAVFVFRNQDDALLFHQALVARMKVGSLNLNLDKSRIVPFGKDNPQGTISFLGFEFYWGLSQLTRPTLKLKTSPKKLNRCLQAFYDWIKLSRNKKSLDVLWQLAAAKLQGHYNYFAVLFNQSKLAHYYHACISALFKWLNRRSQKRSFTWERFKRRLLFNPLPRPPAGWELLDITSEHATERNHKPKSRMRKLRTSGSVRSAGLTPAFT